MARIDENIKKEFIATYNAHADALYRYCFFRIFSKERAEELVQEAFMKTWQYIATGNEVENMRAFLYRVARNLIVDSIRKHKETSLDALMEESNAFEPSGDNGKDLEDRFLAKEVMAHLTSLPKEDHELIVMRFVNDLSLQEISETLGIKINNVSVKLNRAIKKLKKHLVQYG